MTHDIHNIRIMDAAKPVDSVVILRFDADMWFANCLAFKEAVLRELRDTTAAGEDVEVAAAATHASSVRRLVLDFSGVNYMVGLF
jgi:anti-anti-sigma regulatory factor